MARATVDQDGRKWIFTYMTVDKMKSKLTISVEQTTFIPNSLNFVRIASF